MIGELARSVSAGPAQQAVGYPSLFLVVSAGSLVPVLPTGAAVSSAAVVALHQDAVWTLLSVFVVASLAAFTGDLALYWLGRRGVGSRNGSRWLDRLRARAAPERLQAAQERVRAHGVLVLVLSRLVPGGRIPIMLACLLSEMPMRRFARGDLPACLVWAATYELVGMLGGSLFAEPWQGVAVAVLLTCAIAGGPALWRRVRQVRGPRRRGAEG